ncbi:nuclear transport factor 2 family protein [Streptomyces sp. BBFR25]|uniref:nuclear transport factor 2 family protein n=1 Tax=unclassified Streptomyces TaxID=2593676 RepID=UPI000EF5B248|nr:limonene-1,2-epoxide hydrolase family protein [Streptomyces sp. E5N298]
MKGDAPSVVVREFWENFGPTCDDAKATCRRTVHEQVAWESVLAEAKPITSRDELIEDLERARRDLGAEGYHFDVKYVAEQGDVVLSQRIEKVLDKDGEVLHLFDVMALTRVRDGRITWNRDYFYNTQSEAWGRDEGP